MPRPENSIRSNIGQENDRLQKHCKMYVIPGKYNVNNNGYYLVPIYDHLILDINPHF